MKLNLSLFVIGTAMLVSSAVSSKALISHSQHSPSVPPVLSPKFSLDTLLVHNPTQPRQILIATFKHLKPQLSLKPCFTQ